MTSLRIGVACFSSLGGSSVVASEVGTRLAARGHSVRFFGAAPPPRFDPSAPGVSFCRVDPDAPPPVGRTAFHLALAGALAEAARKDGLDVIHAHYAIPHAASAVLARDMLTADGCRSPRIVTTLHGTDVTRFGVDPAWRAVVRHAVRRSDVVTAPSVWLASAAEDRLGPDLGTIEVVPNFVDPEAFRPRPGDLRELFPHVGGWGTARRPRVVLHLSNFRAIKRVGDAVRALSRLEKKHDALLVLVGDGPERAATEALAEQLHLSERVRFLHDAEYSSALLGRADLFVLPSEAESFGLAGLEALASGVPVVATAVEGIPEVVRDGETGLLVPPADPGALAAAIATLLVDEPRRSAMAARAREDAVSRFAPGPAVDRYEALLRPHP